MPHSLYKSHCATHSPQKNAPYRGRYEPHLMYGSLDPLVSHHSGRHLDRISRTSSIHVRYQRTPRQTDRQNGHGTRPDLAAYAIQSDVSAAVVKYYSSASDNDQTRAGEPRVTSLIQVTVVYLESANDFSKWQALVVAADACDRRQLKHTLHVRISCTNTVATSRLR